MSRCLALLLACLCVAAVCHSGLAQTLVSTEYGDVQGHTLPVFNGRDTVDVDVFYSIPFANTTGGENRFKKPTPPAPWQDVFVADTIGNACPQSVGGTIEVTHPGWDKLGEDCLHVNIYTPTDKSGGPYAVMVWLFGGAFQYGANFQYPGHFLATYDVVVVTVNYRVNKFGFATTATDACPGNFGLWDQKLGLEFVVNNIANFGGDPSRITVFGESAGAASTSFQVLSPQSKDLFQQAIMESGAENNVWAITPEAANPEYQFFRGADSVGCNKTTEEETLACMRSLTWENIHENATDFGGGPVVDGPGGFLPMTPTELRDQGDIMRGPILAGINRDDATPLVDALVADVENCCNRSLFMRVIRNRIVRLAGFQLDNETQEAVAEGLIFNYTPWPHLYNNWLNRDQLGQLITDVAFGHPWNQQISDHQKVGDTYAYIFNYRSRNATQIIPEWFGVPHIAEIPYVWGHTLLPQNPLISEDSLINITGVVGITDEDILHTMFLEELWTNFAKFGNPTPTPVINPLGEPTEWGRYQYGDNNVMVISNVSIATQNGYRQEEYYFWDDYFDYLRGKSDEEDDGTLGELILEGLKSTRSLLTRGKPFEVNGTDEADFYEFDYYDDYFV